MIIAWMLYAIAIGVLVAGAAVAGEQMALRNRRATRRVWTLAIGAGAALPVVGVLLKDAPAAREVDGLLTVASPVTGVVMEGVTSLASLDSIVLWSWAAVSAVLGTVLAVSLVSDWLRCRRLPRAEFDGVSVLLTEDVGPAVTGFARARILLPAWAAEAPPEERSMILRHEQEHVTAGDQRLVAFAAAIVVAMPWNPASWFLARRLQLSIEVDCDRRVMEADQVDTRSYAELLLAVGTRRAVPAGPAYGMGFSLGRPFLESRIDRMTARPAEARWSTNALTLLAVGGVLCAAWALPQPVRAADIGSAAYSMDCPLENTAPVTQALIDGILGAT